MKHDSRLISVMLGIASALPLKNILIVEDGYNDPLEISPNLDAQSSQIVKEEPKELTKYDKLALAKAEVKRLERIARKSIHQDKVARKML